MDPLEETAFAAAQKRLQTIIAKAVATALRSFKPPTSTTSHVSQHHHRY
jgi:hypothetical protein